MNDAILYPMVAQGALIFSVLLILARRRIKAVTAGETNPKYFKLLQGEGEPENVVKAQRNFVNQFEMPVLFFAVGMLAGIFERVDDVLVYAAWAYVAVRLLHTIVHIGKNSIMTRFRLFMLSNAILMFMWVWIII